MNLDLTDEETFALLNLLVETIEADRYQMSPGIRLLREILAKVGGLPPELAQQLRRYEPPPRARPSTRRSTIPGGARRQGRRRR